MYRMHLNILFNTIRKQLFSVYSLLVIIFIVTFYLMLTEHSRPPQSQIIYLLLQHSIQIHIPHMLTWYTFILFQPVQFRIKELHFLTSNRTRPNAICTLAKEILNSIEVQQMGLRHSELCLHSKTVRACTWRHVDSAKKVTISFWENETYKAEHVANTNRDDEWQRIRRGLVNQF
jgi:hypothetical protein